MPTFKVTVPHGGDVQSRAELLKSFSEKVRESSVVAVSEIYEEWDSQGNLIFSFKAMGLKISGRLENREEEVHVTGNLPFAALPFRGAIEKEVAAKIREALG